MATALSVTDSTGATVTLSKPSGAVIEPLLTALLASPTLSTNSFGTVVAWNAKGAAGVLLAVRATNANAAVRYLQIHNLAATPTAGAAPLYSVPIPAGTAAAPGGIELSKAFFGDGGAALATGISFALSTTQATYTAASAPDHVVHAHYV